MRGVPSGSLLLTLLPGVAFLIACSAVDSPSRGGGQARSFHFEYAAVVKDIPAGAKKVCVWIPLPQSDEAQEISNLKIESPAKVMETEEKTYGNRLAYIEAQAPIPAEIPVTVAFDVRRREVSSAKGLVPPRSRGRLLAGDRMAPLEGEVAARAGAATSPQGGARKPEGAQETAHAIYDRVLLDVNYDKSGSGWGRGDVAYVCEAGKGNCSDFHALFIGMARASGIPSLFEIGFPLPEKESEGNIAGYHCWAWYEGDDGTWKPVDASEADKDPARKDYYFGTLCCNRVAFSRGRDLILEPRQEGQPVNFLIYPYVEVDGRVDAAKVERQLHFRDAKERA